MNYNILRRMAAAVVLGSAVFAATAQNTLSGYFTDDYMYRFQMNPAFGNSRGFISMPALGNLNVGVRGNLHLNSVLYNVNGQTTTFLNPMISVSEALSNINNVNRIGSENTVNVLSLGFKGFGGYNTINISARASVEAHLPGSLFSLLKEGVANQSYDIGDLRANAYGYAQVALGHSHDINSNLRIGATLKFLVGAGYANANMKDARLRLGEDAWEVETDAEIRASVKGLTYETEVNDRTGHRYVNRVDVEDPGINGYGAAIDLGAIYKTPVDGLTISMSLLDLGYINWDNDMLATTGGVKKFSTDKYTFNVDDEAVNSFDKQWDKIGDDLSALYELDDMGDQGSRSKALHATMNIGVEYALPTYKKLSFGLLNSTRFAGDFSWTDFRLSANWAAGKVFSAGANVGMGTFGFGFGWILNLHAPGFNLFLASDYTPGKLAKQGAPLSTNAHVNFGLNFPF